MVIKKKSFQKGSNRSNLCFFLLRLFTSLLLLTAFQDYQDARAADSPWETALEAGEGRLKSNELEAAEHCFRQALRSAKHDKTASADDVAACLQRLAAVLQTEDQTEEAITLYKKCLRVLRRAHGSKSQALVPIIAALGDIHMCEGEYRPAIKLYRQAISITEKNLNQPNLALADYRHRLGLADFKTGHEQLAETQYSLSLSIIMQQTSLDNTDLLKDVLNDYIDLLRKTCRREDMFPSDFQAELLKDRLYTLPRTKNVPLPAWNMQVSAYLSQSDRAKQTQAEHEINSGYGAPIPHAPPLIVPDKSLPDFAALQRINKQRIDFYQRMIAIDAKSLGPNHPSTARDLTGLAYVYISQNKYNDARLLLDRVLKIYESAYGIDPRLVKRTQAMLDLINGKLTGSDDSAPTIDYTSSLPSIPLQAQQLDIALPLNYLGFLCYNEGKLQEAEKIYAWAAAATALGCGQQTTLAASCLNDYARVLRSADRQAEAERMESYARNILSHIFAKQAALSLH